MTRRGHGEPLLLLHGMGASRRDFAAMMPLLTGDYTVWSLNLPGVGDSPPLSQRPTVGAIADAVEATLDAAGVGTVHVLGNSLGARVALELAARGRARSVVAISPSGLNVLPERIYQCLGMGVARVVMRAGSPLLQLATGSRLGRTALLAPLRAQPWRTSKEEMISTREGFVESRDFARTVLFSLMLDVPTTLRRIECPVTFVQGVADWIASGQTVRFRPLVRHSTFTPLLWAGHAPQSDRPRTIARLVRETAARATFPTDTRSSRQPSVATRAG